MGKKLTDISVKNAKPGTIFDTQVVGLGLKTTNGGRRIWVCQLRYPGHPTQSRRTLGVYPALTLEAARAKAGIWYALVREGRDPAEVEAEKRRAAEAAAAAERRAQQLRDKNTFASVAERYVAQRTNRRAKDDARDIRRLLVSEWGPKPITEITARDVRELINKLLARRVRYDARTSWQHLSCLFQWAVHEELLEASPAASVSKRLLFKGVAFAPRQRVLDDRELFALWRVAGRVGYPHGTIFKLLLLTGLRLNEAAEAQWSEFDPAVLRALRTRKEGERVDWSRLTDEQRLWTVPAARMKGMDVGGKLARPHSVPLTDDILAILEALPRGERGDYLFSTTGGLKPAWQGNKAKKVIDRLMLRSLRAMARANVDDPAKVTLPRWTAHDCRRTVRTRLARLRVPDDVAEAILAHRRPGIMGTYDLYDRLGEKREALELLGQHLLSIVDPSRVPPPSNVVRLRGAA